jgi:hypothetical protein
MHPKSLRLNLVLGLTLLSAVLVPPLSPQSAPEMKLVAPAPGTYVVPAGWREERSEKNVILSITGDKALIYLWIYRNDKRESWQVAGEFAAKQIEQKNFKWTVVSKDLYKYADKEVSRITLNMEAKGKPTRQELILAIPVEGGNLFMLINTIESNLAEYQDAINSVMNPLLPTAPANPKAYPASNATVGLKLMVAPAWAAEPISYGEHSGVAYLKITHGNALLSLSSNQDTRSPKEYVSEVEKNARDQSKSYAKLKEEPGTVAGIQGTRLELRTTNTSDIAFRRWVFVFSRGDRQYVVAAAAPESEFEQFSDDFKQMIASVALVD